MTVAELINELQNYPSHNPVRIFDTELCETIGIEEVIQDYDEDDKLVVFIKTH